MRLIDCPQHPGQHKAELAQHGEKYHGIWECPEGYSDSCPHTNTHVETTEDWPTGPLDTPHEYQIYVCDLCDCSIPLDEADPAADRADAIADTELMMALGK